MVKASALPSPTVTLSIVIATLLGAAFHTVVGGKGRRLLLFLLAGWVGFAVGHGMGVLFDFTIFNIGALNIVPAVIGAVVALLVTQLLTRQPPTARVNATRRRVKASD